MSIANESAFPMPAAYDHGDVILGENGLTKLEYFAALAMQGLIQNAHEDYQFNIPIVVRDAVMYAQALMDELDKQP